MSDRPKRGKELKKIIKEGINYLASQNRNYRYNASELARHINTSRVTLNKYSDYIDEILEEIKVERKGVAGNGMVQHLLDRIEILEQENKELKQENNNLKSDYIDNFQKMYGSSENINKFFTINKGENNE